MRTEGGGHDQPSISAAVLAIIPAHNEGARVASVVAGTRAHLPVLVVDDGSTDETALRAETAGATVLRQVPNQGKGAALRAGFQRALHEGFEAVLTLDADGQHDPSEIPKFLAAYSAHQSDLIVGTRDFAHMPWIRRMTNSLGRRLFSWAVGQPIWDNQSGYRLVSRRLQETMLPSSESGFEFEVEMIVRCVQRGFRLAWIPIRTIYTGEKSHIRPWHHSFHFLRVVLETRRTSQSDHRT
jgi:glycosyltransferase involved in cell wall biosynthesis